METVLKVRDLTKSFGKNLVLNKVSFDVYAGEVFGFLGPNGAGKTTTIKTIMGFLTEDSGTVEICGMDLKKNYEKAMGMVGGIVENPEMYIDLSGRKNLEMYARLHDGVTKERIDEVANIVGMSARIDEKVKRYSLGMKQRIGVAQALLHHPKLLVLDEPTNGLDPQAIKELRDILKHLAHTENVAVIVSSHMLSEMELMCDRVGIIQKGVMVDVRPIDELLSMVNGANTCKIITSEAHKAAEVLTESSYKVVDASEKVVVFEVSEEGIPEAVKLLVNKDVPISGVIKTESSLEDAFIQITKGENQIA